MSLISFLVMRLEAGVGSPAEPNNGTLSRNGCGTQAETGGTLGETPSFDAEVSKVPGSTFLRNLPAEPPHTRQLDPKEVTARVLPFRRLIPERGPVPRLRIPGAPYGENLCINCGEPLPAVEPTGPGLRLSCPLCQEAQAIALREGSLDGGANG